MKKLFLIVVLLVSVDSYSQTEVDKFLDSTLTVLKALSPTDKSDMRVFSVLDDFYNEVLQADNGILSTETSNKVNEYVTNEKTTNRHLLILFLMYQEHIGQAAAEGRRTNVEYQVKTINLVESEFERIHQKVPVIIFVYKAEALETAGKKSDAISVIGSGLKKYPGSIPLKVYKYLGTKDEAVRKDLVTNHSNHWMVQQFGIK